MGELVRQDCLFPSLFFFPFSTCLPALTLLLPRPPLLAHANPPNILSLASFPTLLHSHSHCHPPSQILFLFSSFPPPTPLSSSLPLHPSPRVFLWACKGIWVPVTWCVHVFLGDCIHENTRMHSCVSCSMCMRAYCACVHAYMHVLIRPHIHR